MVLAPIVAACYSKACAPPPIGKGGSDSGPMQNIQPLTRALQAAGGTPYVVGGFVRDKLIGKDSKDIDIEVHGIDADTVARTLRQFGKVDEVGKSFGVLKVSFGGEDLDVSLPRTDSKSGSGHTGFDISVDPHMGIEKALSRRDFTINAIAMTPDGKLVDPFGGAQHLKEGKLVAVSDAFSEDPLRVLRGVQFAGRFGMRMDDRTAQMSRDLLGEIDTLPIERVWGEFEKIGTKGSDLSAVAATIQQVGLQGRYGEIRVASPDLSGLSGDQRVAVVLSAIGADPVRIGATNSVTTRMRELERLTGFEGTAADSRAFARTVKLSTFEDARRIRLDLQFDPAVSRGPIRPLVNGKDLVAQGFRPGPEMGRILKEVTAAQDRGEVTTLSEALAYAERVKIGSR